MNFWNIWPRLGLCPNKIIQQHITHKLSHRWLNPLLDIFSGVFIIEICLLTEHILCQAKVDKCIKVFILQNKLYFNIGFNLLDLNGTSQPFIFINPLCWPWIEQVEGSYPYLRSLGCYVDPHLLCKCKLQFQCVTLVQQADLLSFYSHHIYLWDQLAQAGPIPEKGDCQK